MMQMAKIDITADDQGLVQVYTASSLPGPVVAYLTESCQIKSITDLVMYVATSTWEKEIADVVKGKFPVKEAKAATEGAAAVLAFTAEQQRLYVSRARAAYKLALDVAEKAKNEQNKTIEKDDAEHPDVDRPLDAATIEQLETQWSAEHTFRFISHMRPAPQFRNKIFRELRTQAAKLVPVEKVKTHEENKTAAEPLQIEIGSAEGSKLVYETAKKTMRPIHTTLEYVTALKIIMNTYAYCGSHKVASSSDPQKQVVYFPYEVALSYTDEVTVAILQIRLSSESEKLHWVRIRDEAVRSEMVALMNDGWTGGEALDKSWTKFAHMWIMKDGLGVASSSQISEPAEQSYPRGQVHQREGKAKGTGKGNDKGNKRAKGDNRQSGTFGLKTATMHKGKKYCGAYNSNRGCVYNVNQCPQRAQHSCNVVMPTGEICGSSKHTALTHSGSW